MSKPTIGVEIFPLDRSCTQACPRCFMAQHEKKASGLSIHPRVQYGFSLLEKEVLDYPYDFLFVSNNFSLLPRIENPEKIQKFKFNLDTKYNPDLLSYDSQTSKLRTTLDENGIRPQTISFSIVPKELFVDEDEALLIWRNIRAIQSWYKGNIIVDIRSNFADKNLGSPARRIHSQNAKALSKVSRLDGKCEFDRRQDCSIYFSSLSNKKEKVTITHRIISPYEISYETMIKIQSREIGGHVPISLTPTGLMLNHSSLSISNPTIWFEYEDFFNEFELRSKNGMTEFGYLRFQLLFENYLFQHQISFEKIPLSNCTKMVKDQRRSLHDDLKDYYLRYRW